MKKIFLLVGAVLLLGVGCVKVSTQQPVNTTEQVAIPPISETDKTTVKDLQEKLAKTEDTLLESRVKFAALSMFKTKDVFRHPLNKNKFVLLTSDVGGGKNNQYVGVYDLSKDKNYEKTGFIDLDAADDAFRYVYDESIPDNFELNSPGMDGSKLVIWKKNVDNSPGPCFNLWQGNDLTYIDVDAAKPVRLPYTVPKEKQTEAQKEADQCVKDL